MTLRHYVVRDRSTGDIIVEGPAKECAKVLGMTINSFYAYASRSKAYSGSLDIESYSSSENNSAIDAWNALVYWPNRIRKAGNPCPKCPWRSLCASMDTYCADWAAWFSGAYTVSANKIKTAAKLDNRSQQRV